MAKLGWYRNELAEWHPHLARGPKEFLRGSPIHRGCCLHLLDDAVPAQAQFTPGAVDPGRFRARHRLDV
jgi:hypothetical protein